MLDKSREQPHSPITATPACHSVLLPLSALLSRKQSGFSSAAEPLRHGQISELTRLTGTKSLVCQNDASAVSESYAQFRLSTREEARAGFQDKLFSCCKFPHLSKHLPWTQQSPVPPQHEGLEGRSWLHCQAMAEGAGTFLEVQSSHLPCLEDIRSQLLQASNQLSFAPTSLSCI